MQYVKVPSNAGTEYTLLEYELSVMSGAPALFHVSH